MKHLRLKQDFSGTYHLALFEGNQFIEILRFSITLKQAAAIAAKMRLELH